MSRPRTSRAPAHSGSRAKQPPVIPAAGARRLLLDAQGLLDDPGRMPPATPRAVSRLVERMGFVQVDTISTVERAHHLILAARMNGYRPAMLARALEREPRSLFEHWTHDASVIPLKWYPHWRHRFARYRDGTWHHKHLGPDGDRLLDDVLKRVAREGPLESRDFEHDGEAKPGSWWGWKPPKVALDYLWRTGVLHVAARRNFAKVYDLTERVIAEHASRPMPSEAEHLEWACRTALERLGGVATGREIAQFWNAVSVQQVSAWLAAAVAAGEVIPALVASADGSAPKPSYALPDLPKRIARLPDPPAGIRMLCPFDPVLRDRARAKRLFDFDFRFEGFVPAGQRKHGYYAMAMLEGDRFVGRIDPKFDRASGTLRVQRVWWEPGVAPTRKRLAAFNEGVGKLASWIGATAVDVERVSGG